MREGRLADRCTGRKSSPGSLRDAPHASCFGPSPVALAGLRPCQSTSCPGSGPGRPHVASGYCVSRQRTPRERGADRSSRAQSHVAVFGRQHHILDVGHLHGQELARAGSRAGGPVVQAANQGGGAVPCLVSRGFETSDPQEHGEWKKRFRAGDGARDSGLGRAFGQPLASEAETGSAEQGKEKPHNSREDSHLLIDLCERVHQLLAFLLNRLHGDDRALAAPSPGGNSRSRDRRVLGHASGAGTNHLVPEPVVVGTACM